MINGDRVRQVRELLGLTQIQFAECIGVTQSEIAHIESGRNKPADDIIQRIVLQTGFPLSFFKQPASVDFPLGSLLFRARQSVSLREKGEARQYARTLFELAENLEKDIDKIPLHLPRLDDEPRSAAIHTRSFLGLSPDTPIDNLINVIERNGVLVLALPISIEKTDAFSAWVGTDKKRPVIAITNINVPGDRLRFNMAHELGHLVMHQAIIGNTKEIEKEADLFASEFLMPQEAMLKEITTPVTILNLMQMKPRWRVSIQALIRVCHDLQIITPRQYKYLMQQISARGWRKKEPININTEKPRLVGQMVEMLYGIPVDYKQLASRLSLPPRLVRRVLEVHAIKSGSLNNDQENAPNNKIINLFPKKSY